MQNVQPIPGAEKALQELQAMKLLLATTTGFDRPLTTQVLSHLGWQHYFVASITSDDVVDGRPAPYMLFRAMEAAHVNDTAAGAGGGRHAAGPAGRPTMAAWARRSGSVRGPRQKAACGKRSNSAVLPSVADLPGLIRKGLPLRLPLTRERT